MKNRYLASIGLSVGITVGAVVGCAANPPVKISPVTTTLPAPCNVGDAVEPCGPHPWRLVTTGASERAMIWFNRCEARYYDGPERWYLLDLSCNIYLREG